MLIIGEVFPRGTDSVWYGKDIMLSERLKLVDLYYHDYESSLKND